MEKNGKKAVLINDFDGVHNRGSTKGYLNIIENTLLECGIVIDPKILHPGVLKHWGLPPKKILSSFVKSQSSYDEFPGVNKEALRLYHNSMMNEFPDMITPVEGSSELLEELAEEYDLALNSSADRDVLMDAVMPRLGIDPGLFKPELVWTADDLTEGQEKPDPYVINQVLRITGFKPWEALMIGDSQADVLSAYYAGVEPVVPLTGNLDREGAQNMDVEFIIEDVTKIKTILPMALGKKAVRLAFG